MATKPKYEKKQAPIPASMAPWLQTPDLYLAGRAATDGTDELAVQMEAKWGVGRLRLLVSDEWREKFDRQRRMYNEAIDRGSLDDVRHEAKRMSAAWRKLDAEATAAGKSPLAPEQWEIMNEDGLEVIIIVRDELDAINVARNNRACTVYSLAEVGRILAAYPEIAKIKHTFPGATVTAARRKADPVSLSGNENYEDDLPF